LGDTERDGGRGYAGQHPLVGRWFGHSQNLPASRRARPYEVVTASAHPKALPDLR
jgi:hypothetical protein